MSNVSISGRTTAAPTSEGEKGSGLGRIIVLAVGTFAVGTDAFILAGFLPDVAASLHTSTASAGQAVTIFAGTYALASPLVATATARLPRRALLVAALIVLAVANAASALAPNLPLLLASRVLAAAGAAGYTPTAGAVSAALVRPELRGRALSVVVSGLTVATALGVPLGDAVGAVMGWRAALGLVAALCVVTAVAAGVLMPTLAGASAVGASARHGARSSGRSSAGLAAAGNAPTPTRPNAAPTPSSTRLAALRRPGVAAVLPLTVLGMAAAYTVYAYAVPALHAVGISGSGTAWMLSAYGVGAIAGNLSAGIAADRVGPIKVLAAGYLLMTATMSTFALLAATHTRAPLAVALLAAAWGAASWCQTPPQQHRLITAAPTEAPLLMALNASSIYVGIGAGTALGGLLVPSGVSPSNVAPSDVAVMFSAAAGLAVLALAWLIATRPRRHAHVRRNFDGDSRPDH